MTTIPGDMDYDGPMHIVTGDVEAARRNCTELTTLCGITYVPTPTIIEKKDRGTCDTCMAIHKENRA